MNKFSINNVLRTMLNTLFAFCILFINFTIHAQPSITVAGNVIDQQSSPLKANITVNQLVGDLWEFRAEGSTDSNGEFNILMNNITSVENIQFAPLAYSLQGDILYSPIKTASEIIYYNLLGEKVSRQKVEIKAGSNVIKNQLYQLANGVYIRSVILKEGIITQKIVKQGNHLSYGTSGINRVKVSTQNNIRLGKVLVDSLYIMTIASTQGYMPDTIVTSISKDNSSDITGLIHELSINENYIDFEFGWWSVHGLTREGKTIHFQDMDDTTNIYSFICGQDNRVNVQIELPVNHSGTFKIYQDDPADSLMETAVFETKFSGATIAVTEEDKSIYWVYPWIITNIHKLDSAATADELGYFDVPRYAQTNNYPANGVPGEIDLKNANWGTMYLPGNGFNYRWEKTQGLDSVYVIGSPIDQGNNPQNLSQETLTEYRNSVQQIINLANQLPNEAWTNIPFTKMREYDDVEHNPLLDSLTTHHGDYNWFAVYFGDGDNGGYSIDGARRIKNALAHFNPPSQMTTMISEQGIVAALDDPPSPPVFAFVGDIWHATNVPGYNNSELTEAAYLMFHFRQKTPKDYVFPR